MNTEWPPRPPGEIFPELLTTLDVAMLLRYDSRHGVTPDKGRRAVRQLVREGGLPTLGRVGSSLLYRKDAVLAWLIGRGTVVSAQEQSKPVIASTPGLRPA